MPIHRRSQILILLLVTAQLAVLIKPPLASAVMPERAYQELQQVLEQDKYHPRGAELTISEKIWQRLWPKVEEVLREINAWFESAKTDGDKDSGAPGWLVWFADAMTKVLLYGGGAILLYFILRAALPFLMPSLLALRQRGGGAVVVEAERPLPMLRVPLRELFKSAQLTELVAALRSNLRHELETRHRVTQTTTDRRLLAALPKSEKQWELFSDTARTFEAFAFALKVPSSGEVESLLERYEAGAPKADKSEVES